MSPDVESGDATPLTVGGRAPVAVDDAGRVVHQPRGRIGGFRMPTGVREAGGRLWFGRLEGSTAATTAVPQSAGAVP